MKLSWVVLFYQREICSTTFASLSGSSLFLLSFAIIELDAVLEIHCDVSLLSDPLTV